MDLHKMESAERFIKMGFRAWIIVQFDDGAYRHVCRPSAAMYRRPEKNLGRRDRDDPLDVKPVVLIPVADWTLVPLL